MGIGLWKDMAAFEIGECAHTHTHIHTHPLLNEKQVTLRYLDGVQDISHGRENISVHVLKFLVLTILFL